MHMVYLLYGFLNVSEDHWIKQRLYHAIDIDTASLQYESLHVVILDYRMLQMFYYNIGIGRVSLLYGFLNASLDYHG